PADLSLLRSQLDKTKADMLSTEKALDELNDKQQSLETKKAVGEMEPEKESVPKEDTPEDEKEKEKGKEPEEDTQKPETPEEEKKKETEPTLTEKIESARDAYLKKYKQNFGEKGKTTRTLLNF